jgi:predicted P-loop ATPase
LRQSLKKIAKHNSFHPIREFLLSFEKSCKSYPAALLGFSKCYFGLDSQPIENIFIRWLISAAKRVFKPGSRLEFVPILQSWQQGTGKPSFWRTLGGDFFTDAVGENSAKDEIQKLSTVWIAAWGEIERILQRRHQGSVKNFITQVEDFLECPMAESPQNF